LLDLKNRSNIPRSGRSRLNVHQGARKEPYTEGSATREIEGSPPKIDQVSESLAQTIPFPLNRGC
jgi:hypothetical protein